MNGVYTAADVQQQAGGCRGQGQRPQQFAPAAAQAHQAQVLFLLHQSVNAVAQRQRRAQEPGIDQLGRHITRSPACFPGHRAGLGIQRHQAIVINRVAQRAEIMLLAGLHFHDVARMRRQGQVIHGEHEPAVAAERPLGRVRIQAAVHAQPAIELDLACRVGQDALEAESQPGVPQGSASLVVHGLDTGMACGRAICRRSTGASRRAGSRGRDRLRREPSRRRGDRCWDRTWEPRGRDRVRRWPTSAGRPPSWSCSPARPVPAAVHRSCRPGCVAGCRDTWASRRPAPGRGASARSRGATSSALRSRPRRRRPSVPIRSSSAGQARASRSWSPQAWKARQACSSVIGESFAGPGCSSSR